MANSFNIHRVTSFTAKADGGSGANWLSLFFVDNEGHRTEVIVYGLPTKSAKAIASAINAEDESRET